MCRRLFALLFVITLLGSFWAALPVSANPPAPDDTLIPRVVVDSPRPITNPYKPIDQPNPKDFWRIRERQQLLESGKISQAAALAAVRTDRVLVLLVEFASTDTFTWTEGTSHWDPLGRADANEAVYDQGGNVVAGDCSNILAQTGVYSFTGPLHNEIPRPLSEADRSGDTIWTPDFSPQWYRDFMFGDGVTFDYTRQDSSRVYGDFRGKSVRKYYEDMSAGQYSITGTVAGWLQLPHSVWWYGADPCPGARSGPLGGFPHSGAIPGAGSAKSLVKDALNAVNAISNTIPGFRWEDYDQDGDKVIDRLWVIHAGYGEEDGATLLNRTTYGEGTLWSHSSSVTPAYPVGAGISAGPYIMMPENGGIGVFAHESGHNLGAGDLYAYGLGETSAGFWTAMADDWTGHPIGFQPPAMDPLHLDQWGWLNPYVITDTTKEYVFKIGQASNFPGGAGVYRGARIELAGGIAPLAAQPIGSYQWWGGQGDLLNAMMISKSPIPVPAGGATLVFSSAYGIEAEWDFLWVAAGTSPTDMSTWRVLTNTHTVCTHAPEWIGGAYGFPDDLCAAGWGGLTGSNASFPDYGAETFDLTPFAGQSLYLAFWYMTDWSASYEGPFIDNIVVRGPGGAVLFSDDAESGDAKWTYRDGWSRSDGTQRFSHNYYLQWRNVNANGGYDSALGDARWRYGPANTGLLVWYNNNLYADNEVYNYMTDFPGFGPKGRMLVVDSHSDPYRDPSLVAKGYNNEGGNLPHRSLMRDAPFSLARTVGFTMTTVYSGVVSFAGRPAVSVFNDAVGYYPGAEFVKRSPSQSAAWITKQWDAGAVIPARANYGIKAPGYTANEDFRFAVAIYSDGKIYGTGIRGLGYSGGTGNPREAGAQYGWRVQLLEEAPDHTWARVRVYNAFSQLWLPVILKSALP